jgi:hypothetical protein
MLAPLHRLPLHRLPLRRLQQAPGLPAWAA